MAKKRRKYGLKARKKVKATNRSISNLAYIHYRQEHYLQYGLNYKVRSPIPFDPITQYNNFKARTQAAIKKRIDFKNAQKDLQLAKTATAVVNDFMNANETELSSLVRDFYEKNHLKQSDENWMKVDREAASQLVSGEDMTDMSPEEAMARIKAINNYTSKKIRKTEGVYVQQNIQLKNVWTMRDKLEDSIAQTLDAGGIDKAESQEIIARQKNLLKTIETIANAAFDGQKQMAVTKIYKLIAKEARQKQNDMGGGAPAASVAELLYALDVLNGGKYASSLEGYVGEHVGLMAAQIMQSLQTTGVEETVAELQKGTLVNIAEAFNSNQVSQAGAGITTTCQISGDERTGATGNSQAMDIRKLPENFTVEGDSLKTIFGLNYGTRSKADITVIYKEMEEDTPVSTGISVKNKSVPYQIKVVDSTSGPKIVSEIDPSLPTSGHILNSIFAKTGGNAKGLELGNLYAKQIRLMAFVVALVGYEQKTAPRFIYVSTKKGFNIIPMSYIMQVQLNQVENATGMYMNVVGAGQNARDIFGNSSKTNSWISTGDGGVSTPNRAAAYERSNRIWESYQNSKVTVTLRYKMNEMNKFLLDK